MVRNMKIVVVHSNNFDFVNELYLPLRNSKLNVEHEFLLPHENGKEEITKEIVRNCDAVVAEVSYSSTGLGIELGWADVFKKPIMCMYKEGSKISSSLKHITDTFISYKDTNDMIEKVAAALADIRR